MDGVARRQAARGNGAPSRRRHPCDQLDRASRAGGAAHRAARQTRRSGKRACRHRLRFFPRSLQRQGPSIDPVGEAQGAGGGGGTGEQGTVALEWRGWGWFAENEFAGRTTESTKIVTSGLNLADHKLIEYITVVGKLLQRDPVGSRTEIGSIVRTSFQASWR